MNAFVGTLFYYLQIPFLKDMKVTSKTVWYNNLDVAYKPSIEDKEFPPLVNVRFKKRIYDADPYNQVARTREQSMRTMPICTNLHVKTITLGDWQHLMDLVVDGNDQDLKEFVGDKLDNLKQVKAFTFTFPFDQTIEICYTRHRHHTLLNI